MKVYFIRHGKTLGNVEGRYVGSTDQPLIEEGIIELKKKSVPDADVVYVSPLLRCRETADILYPDVNHIIVDTLKEINFGDFEAKTEEELKEDPVFVEWIKNHGKVSFLNGESLEEFQIRCYGGFLSSIKESYNLGHQVVAFVVHGGTIMALMDACSNPHKHYHHWIVDNGCGYGGELKQVDDKLLLDDIVAYDYL